jgi:hypothetical protein
MAGELVLVTGGTGFVGDLAGAGGDVVRERHDGARLDLHAVMIVAWLHA